MSTLTNFDPKIRPPGNFDPLKYAACMAQHPNCIEWGDSCFEKSAVIFVLYTIPMNDIFNLNSTILPENLEVFYSTLPCQP